MLAIKCHSSPRFSGRSGGGSATASFRLEDECSFIGQQAGTAGHLRAENGGFYGELEAREAGVAEPASRARIYSMKLADSTTRADYLPATRKADFGGVTGEFAFDTKADLRAAAVTLYEVRSGKVQRMSTVT